MCLIVTLEVPVTDREALDSASIRANEDGIHIAVKPVRSFPWVRIQHVQATFSEEAGCACSMLHDDADWDAETWSFRPESRTRLASALVNVLEKGVSEFSFEASWAGEVPETILNVGFDDLIVLVAEGRLGTRTRYVVGKANS